MKDYLLAFLRPAAARLTRPIVSEVKKQVHRLLMAICLAATGVACIIAGLTYFASSLWHALSPVMGTVGADVLLGGAYVGSAALLLALALRMVR